MTTFTREQFKKFASKHLQFSTTNVRYPMTTRIEMVRNTGGLLMMMIRRRSFFRRFSIAESRAEFEACKLLICFLFCLDLFGYL